MAVILNLQQHVSTVKPDCLVVIYMCISVCACVRAYVCLWWVGQLGKSIILNTSPGVSDLVLAPPCKLLALNLTTVGFLTKSLMKRQGHSLERQGDTIRRGSVQLKAGAQHEFEEY